MKESQGLVSVIVSVYNIENQLHHCLESLTAQTYWNLEIILIDDGSTDGSGRICDEFAANDPRARVIHQENRGLWSVRNRGVKAAKGEYVVFPDGDDYFHKDYIRLLYEAINLGGKEYPLAICGYTRSSLYNEDTESDLSPRFEEIDQTILLNQATCFPSCASALWGANWNKLYRRAFLPEPFQKKYLRCQDYDSNLRFYFNVDRAILIRNDLYFWVQHPGQLTRSEDYWFIRGESRCQIFYDNYNTIPKRLSHYRASFIANMYKGMVSWKESARGTVVQEVMSKKILGFEKKTLLYMLFSKKISVRSKIRWILSLHAPSLLGLFNTRVRLYWA